MKKLVVKKWVRWGVIPVILFGLWFTMTVVYIILYDESFTVLSYNHPKESFDTVPQEKLLKGHKISGEFEAKENNLGIVAIRFKVQQRIPWSEEDILIFRIKESGQNRWYYENKYRSGLTYDVPFLPMGFPIIQDSLGKTYSFELISTKGNNKNGVLLSDKRPILSSRYQVSKSELLQDPIKLMNFLKVKVLNSLSTPDIHFSSAIYLLPLIFYVFWLFGLVQKFSNKLYNFLLSKKIFRDSLPYIKVSEKGITVYLLLLISVVLYDIFFIQVQNDFVYLTILFLWIFLVDRSRIHNSITFVSALSFLFLAPLSSQLDSISTAEKAAAWAFIFLAGGVVYELFSLRKAAK